MIQRRTIQKLKKILEKQNHTTYAMEEIRQIGNDLIEFYEFLAELDAEESDDDDSLV